MFSLFCKTTEALLRVLGVDAFIQRDDSGQGFFALEYRKGNAGSIFQGGDSEVWGLGLYVILSPVRAPRRA